MTLTELLRPELVFPKTACASKDDLIDKLVGLICDIDREFPFSREDLLKNIHRREQIGGTLLPSGLSIPHARLKDFDGFIFAMATPAEPLFHEEQEIRLASMMITSQSGGPWYLTVLAALAKISKDEAFFSRLCGAENMENFVSILRERDQELA